MGFIHDQRGDLTVSLRLQQMFFQSREPLGFAGRNFADTETQQDRFHELR